ncbi:hypothetical protein Bca4012_065664 [Brassica carinata]
MLLSCLRLQEGAIILAVSYGSLVEKITTTPRRDIKRESRREEKVVKAAVLDKSTKVINKYHDQDTTDHVTSGFIDESEMQRH